MFIKRKLGFYIFVLALCLVLSYSLTKASSVVKTVSISKDGIRYQQYTTATGYYYKEYDGDFQRVSSENAFTTITNPCPNCVIGVRIHTDGNTYSNKVIVRIGEKKGFTEASTAEGNWQMEVMRDDITLMNTSFRGTWYINN